MNKKFLLEDYLQSISIPFKSSGKNIGEGWIGIKDCPECGDHNYHLGVNLQTGIFTCWICKCGGNTIKLIIMLEQVSYIAALKIYENYSLSNEKVSSSLLEAIEQARGIHQMKPKTIKVKKAHILLPDKLIPLGQAFHQFPVLRKYLYNRGFSIQDVDSWGESWLCTNGKFAGRIIFPVYMEGKLVNYVGRTIISHPLRYMYCSNADAITPIKDCIYNYDRWMIGDQIVVTEGIFDALKTKKLLENTNVIAIFGKQVSNKQLLLIGNKRPSLIYLFLDRDAWKMALEMTQKIKMFTNCEIKVITPSLKDPDSYNDKGEMEKLFNESV